MRRISGELVDDITRRHFGFEQSTDRWTQPARLCPAVACFRQYSWPANVPFELDCLAAPAAPLPSCLERAFKAGALPI